MSQEKDVNTLDEELDQNTDTAIDTDTDSDKSDDNTASTSADSLTDTDNTDEQDEGDELDAEQINSMSDEEFIEYMNSGKAPSKAEKEEETKPTPDKAKVVKKPTEDTKPKETEPKQEQTINYEEIYKRIFSPFKANGKEITPRTPEDVISLMQMGANYTKKMQVMAPMRKIVESLSKAGVNEEDLNFLIDVYKGDKEAIKELLKKNELDITDLDLDEVNYKPNKNNIASDEDVSFAETLSDINESIPQIQEILNKTWDAESKRLLLSDPRAMRALHEEIQMGRFEKVQKQLEVEKTFGRYKDVPDVQAYIDLVNRMVANEQVNTPKAKETPKTTKSVPDKRKAAPTRSTPKGSSTLTAKDLFSMSDEEFERLSIKDLV